MSAKGRVQLRSSVGSAAHLAPMALRKSSFAQTSFTVRSETELSAAVNSIQMALKDGQKPIVIGLAAGVLPARNAARLQPLDALRAE